MKLNNSKTVAVWQNFNVQSTEFVSVHFFFSSSHMSEKLDKCSQRGQLVTEMASHSQLMVCFVSLREIRFSRYTLQAVKFETKTSLLKQILDQMHSYTANNVIVCKNLQFQFNKIIIFLFH